MKNNNIFRQWTLILLVFAIQIHAQQTIPPPFDNSNGGFDGTGRVGINTVRPEATLHIAETLTDFERGLNSIPDGSLRPQGVLLPTFTTEQLAKFGNVKYGTMVYNSDEDCIQVFKRTSSWACLCTCDTPPPAPQPQPQPIPEPIEPEPIPEPIPEPQHDFKVSDYVKDIILQPNELTGSSTFQFTYTKTSQRTISFSDIHINESYPDDGLTLSLLIYGNTITSPGTGIIEANITYEFENASYMGNPISDKTIPLQIDGANFTLVVTFTN